MAPPESANLLVALPPFKPDLYQRAWQSIPHPTLPLLATAHQKSVTVFSLSTLSAHSALTNGHDRSVRSTTWKPNLSPHKLCLVTGSFDSTAGLWRWNDEAKGELEVDVTEEDSDDDKKEKEWDLIVILDGQDSEVKSVSFSPTGQFLATCSRDKSVWIWEDVGTNEEDDEWETVAVLSEHEGDVKAVAWCPETNRSGRGRPYMAGGIRAEWVCVAVLEGHEGTVWGVQWEPKPRGEKFPRILTWSADRTLRIWTLKEEEEEEEAPQHAWGSLGGIPNTMRRALKEEWECTAVLPTAHTRDIYSASWSPESGMVASTGSDGIIAVYREEEDIATNGVQATDDEAAAELDGDVHMTNGHTQNNKPQESRKWKLISTTPNAHGAYEVNHITWCKRYDQGCAPEKRGIEEMLVSTGDDGIVRPWQIL
ncbi:putative cytosolic iron-sulfur protein assembly protein 1 [Daldinia childiae]|uniref:putative cytosolic iron-sulfur protein assembly protein 1 n=1 Tax=Daldinia childiae TaxID=326645 RepID=UPI0014489CC8|nr:putative cytosolic iron-sulfur protein assembly protein 1 [Daldinia childiae]KAF3070436.1 putative cytosolic iron-sulfur protein assembly protein 1 [Daldinia childiae]